MSHPNGFNHFEQLVIRSFSVESNQYISNVGLESWVGLRVHQPLVDILVQLHYLEQVVLKILELLLITTNDFLLRCHNLLHLLNLLRVQRIATTEFHLETFRLHLLVDPVLLICLFPLNAFNHRLDVFVLV